MEQATYDVFAGISRQHARWIETVQGLANARERMWQIAGEIPGCYFISSSREGSILTKIETFEKSQPGRKAAVRKAHA
jgi:hypothetical protein